MERVGVGVATTNSDTYVGNSNSSSSQTTTSYSSFQIARFLQAPVTTVLEHSGFLRPRSIDEYHESESLIPHHRNRNSSDFGATNSNSSSNSNNEGEVSIRIIGDGEQEEGHGGESAVISGDAGGIEREMADSNGIHSNSDSSNQRRYDLQQVSRWIEQILPFSLLLIVVFIRQHLQGFFVTIYITAFMYKSNDILRKQTSLKGERKLSVLVGYSIIFMLHVVGVYWWFQNDDLSYPLLMVPPKTIPLFWHAIFIIIVNDTMVRQAAMTLKLILLMYYKNGRGYTFRRQGQMLTLVEYAL